MLYAICADRGAPGSTTTALALASARGLPALVVEADPYGGDLALRLQPDGKHPMATTPTVLSAAAGRTAAGRQGSPQAAAGMRSPDLWRAGAHELSGLVRVVPGFMTAEQGAPLGWPALAEVLAAQTVPVFADIGRVHTGSPSMPILTAADAVIPVCRGDMGSVHHMMQRLEALVPAIAEKTGRTPMLLPIVVTHRKHSADVAKSVWHLLARSGVSPAVRGVRWLAWDPGGCALLEHGADPWQRPLRRSPLMASARKAVDLVGVSTGLDTAHPQHKQRRRSTTPVGSGQPHEPAATPAADEAAATDPVGSSALRSGHAWARPVPAGHSHGDVGQRGER